MMPPKTRPLPSPTPEAGPAARPLFTAMAPKAPKAVMKTAITRLLRTPGPPCSRPISMS